MSHGSHGVDAHSTGSRSELKDQLVVEVMVRDLEKSLALYTALGFVLERRDGSFAAMRYDEARFFLDERRDLVVRAGPSRANVRILVHDVDEMWERVRSLGLAVENPVADKSYGLRDFTVVDPDGFGLRFASPLRPVASEPGGRPIDGGLFKLEGIDHVALTVTDVGRSARWYATVLGLERRFEDVWGDMPAVMGTGTTSLALFPVTVADPAGPPGPDTLCFRHVAFRVARRGFERVREALEEQGIATEFQDHDAAHSLYFLDPDGHQLEVTTYEV